jgi:hypothetical protein
MKKLISHAHCCSQPPVRRLKARARTRTAVRCRPIRPWVPLAPGRTESARSPTITAPPASRTRTPAPSARETSGIDYHRGHRRLHYPMNGRDVPDL